MSSAAQSIAAAVPLDSNVQGLERRLLELRAEIDAILTQLAGQKAAPVADEPVAAPAPQAQEADAEPALALAAMPEPADADIALDADVEAQADAKPEIEGDADAHLVHALDIDAGTPDQPDQPSVALSMPDDAAIAELPSAEQAIEPSSGKTEAGDGSETLGLDRQVSTEDGTEPAAILASSETTAIASQHDHVATSTTAPAMDAEAQAHGEPTPDVEETSAAVSTQATAPAAPAADDAQQARAEVPGLPVISDVPVATPVDAEARVIDFAPRHRKQKGTFIAVGAAPVRRGRRVATRVAVGIIAMIAAAAALVVADRTAVGSAQSLPWISPLPVPSGATWPFLGQLRSADQSVGSRDDAASAGLSAVSEALQARYREVWPTSP